MTNSRASSIGTLQLLDTHLASTTEATYTYTPSSALDMVTVYREIIIQFTGKSTGALGLAIKLNGITDYNYNESELDTTTYAGSLTDAGTTTHLITSAVLDGANSFIAKIHILYNDASDRLMLLAEMGIPHEGQQSTNSEVQTAGTTITSIELLVTTSTWIAGTEITIYGVRR